jgi:hypothetical protein
MPWSFRFMKEMRLRILGDTESAVENTESLKTAIFNRMTLAALDFSVSPSDR